MTKPTQPVVTITEITIALAEERYHDKEEDLLEEGSLKCTLCKDSIGLNLIGDEDRPVWYDFFEVKVTYVGAITTDIDYICDSCFGYLQTIAPAVLAKDTGYYV